MLSSSHISTLQLILISTAQVISVSIDWNQVYEDSHGHKRSSGVSSPSNVDKSLSKCVEPSNLSEQLIEWNQLSLSHSSNVSKAARKRRRHVSNKRQHFESFTSNDEICNELPSTDSSSDVMARALCPWEWRVNREEEREPKIISEAHCLCRRSRGSTVADCVPIQREIPVLKRYQCQGDVGLYQYKRTYVTITVGCHSVMPRMRRAAPLNSWYPSSGDT